jgi:UDP-3-O-[3-hydroxymyristoyl] glucosamine N-acyltransferase
MADSRFYERKGPFTTKHIAEIAEASLAEGVDGNRLILDVNALEIAGPDDVSFADNKRYQEKLTHSLAGACLVLPALADSAPAGMALLFSDSPYRSYALVAAAFYPSSPAEFEIDPKAVIGLGARIGQNTKIGPGAVIGTGAEIGPECRIEANAVIGRGVILGKGSTIGTCVSLSHCIIGCRVTIYPGTCVGQDGFGYIMNPEQHIKVPQLGRVIIGDNVEIGANVTIDRGAAGDTVIGSGCIIDNLVQIGHNVEIGAGTVIIAQAGIAGSSKLGDHVILAAQSGVSGHLKIGAGAKIAAQAGVFRDVKRGEEVCGAPAIPIRQFWRQQVRLTRLSEGKGK